MVSQHEKNCKIITEVYLSYKNASFTVGEKLNEEIENLHRLAYNMCQTRCNHNLKYRISEQDSKRFEIGRDKDGYIAGACCPTCTRPVDFQVEIDNEPLIKK